MKIYYFPGTEAPEKYDVYLLANGQYARYENGIWYKQNSNYENALKTTIFAGFLSPHYRNGRHHRWTQVQFVVFDEAEYAIDGKGFWSNEDGWTTLEKAQTYAASMINQPMLSGRFIPLHEALELEEIITL